MHPPCPPVQYPVPHFLNAPFPSPRPRRPTITSARLHCVKHPGGGPWRGILCMVSWTCTVWRSSRRCPGGLCWGPVPCTLCPMPGTLCPKPGTLHPVPCTLHPVPCTLRPIPCTLCPAPCAIPCALYPVSYPVPYALCSVPHPGLQALFMECDLDHGNNISQVRPPYRPPNPAPTASCTHSTLHPRHFVSRESHTGHQGLSLILSLLPPSPPPHSTPSYLPRPSWRPSSS